MLARTRKFHGLSLRADLIDLRTLPRVIFVGFAITILSFYEPHAFAANPNAGQCPPGEYYDDSFSHQCVPYGQCPPGEKLEDT